MMTPQTIRENQTSVDWLMILAIAGLMAVGASFIYSATMANESLSVMPWYRQLYLMQSIWYTVGISGAVILCLIDYHALARWSLVIYWLTILLLIAVLIPGIGSMRFGARRWIDLGFFQIQPSEFAKLSFIFAQAHFLSRPPDELRIPSVFWKALGLMVLPFVLIMKEPDLGSALILLPVGMVMLYVAGVPVQFLRRLVGAAAIVVALILVDVLFAPPKWQIKLEEYQKRRLLVYFGRDFAGPNATPAQKAEARRQLREHSYNVEQALISVGSGGVFGKGWRQGTQNALGYLPRAVAHNDFIFSVIAEEKGFMGSVIVLALYSVVLFTGIRIAGQTRDRLGKLLAVGVVTMLFSHVFINIGMNIRLMPVTGVPLPLLSYGGSSVLCSLIAIGILQNVYLYRRSY
jgi:rod shape determining protein RodA